ncbi:MAG: S-layer homology domain-containing protein [Nitrospirota bacterium]
MRRFLTIITISALFLPLTIQTASAQFSDLFKNNKNYEAIIFLEGSNILVGYSDGTFRPNNEVNRAEFLKITLEGSKIPLDKNDISLPFPDTQNDEWYRPYIQKAYDSGWIVGFNDGTFKPDQTITKAEALKILGEVQQWQLNENPQSSPFQDIDLNEWYAAYVVYANDHDYLEENGELFEPQNLMTRANISEVLYRTITVENEEAEVDIEEEVEIEEKPAATPVTFEKTPVAFKEIPIDFFDNITLSTPLPNTFYKNETYVIEGQINSDNYDTISIFLDNDMYTDLDYLLFTGEVTNGQFEIPVHFRETENYTIGIIPGTNGNTKIEEISVLTSLPSPSDTDSPTGSIENLSISYENKTTSLKFNAPSDSLKIFTFKQENDSVEFISRQNRDNLPLYYPAFEDFSEGNVTYLGQLNNTSSASTPEKSFEAVEHTYDQIDEDKISATIPDTLPKFQDISINGTTKTDTLLEGFVIKPDGLVESVMLETSSETSNYFGSEIIVSGNNFEFDYVETTKGRYIIEIIDNYGVPIVNHPVYIGSIIPLIPDYFDLNERAFFSGILDLDALRKDLLNEINDNRSVYGYSEIKLNSELNTLAQNHSEDMAENDFFGHINLENQTPDDRRLEDGINMPVSENIAKDVSVIFAHLGLMRSGSHRENILNPDWHLVGLGIAQSNGYIYVTEEFSAGEITASDLTKYKNSLIDEVNDQRESNGLSALTYQNSIESVCTDLNNKTISENIILTTEDLSTALELHDIAGTSQYTSRTYNIWSVILSSILKDEESSILDESWVNIGVDIQLDETGMIHVSFILNK